MNRKKPLVLPHPRVKRAVSSDLFRDEYANIISNTRIALCPMGFRSTECFRLLETMRLGCVMISDKLPPSR